MGKQWCHGKETNALIYELPGQPRHGLDRFDKKINALSNREARQEHALNL